MAVNSLPITVLPFLTRALITGPKTKRMRYVGWKEPTCLKYGRFLLRFTSRTESLTFKRSPARPALSAAAPAPPAGSPPFSGTRSSNARARSLRCRRGSVWLRRRSGLGLADGRGGPSAGVRPYRGAADRSRARRGWRHRESAEHAVIFEQLARGALDRQQVNGERRRAVGIAHGDGLHRAAIGAMTF